MGGLARISDRSEACIEILDKKYNKILGDGITYKKAIDRKVYTQSAIPNIAQRGVGSEYDKILDPVLYFLVPRE